MTVVEADVYLRDILNHYLDKKQHLHALLMARTSLKKVDELEYAYKEALNRIKELEYAYNFQDSIICQSEKTIEELSDRVVKAEGLISESKIRQSKEIGDKNE